MENKNFKYVKVRENRLCSFCGRVIFKDTRCLTVNKKYKGRKWVCTDCIKAIENVDSEQALLKAVPFNDEVAYTVQSKCFEEVLGNLYSRLKPDVQDALVKIMRYNKRFSSGALIKSI